MIRMINKIMLSSVFGVTEWGINFQRFHLKATYTKNVKTFLLQFFKVYFIFDCSNSSRLVTNMYFNQFCPAPLGLPAHRLIIAHFVELRCGSYGVFSIMCVFCWSLRVQLNSMKINIICNYSCITKKAENTIFYFKYSCLFMINLIDF